MDHYRICIYIEVLKIEKFAFARAGWVFSLILADLHMVLTWTFPIQFLEHICLRPPFVDIRLWPKLSAVGYSIQSAAICMLHHCFCWYKAADSAQCCRLGIYLFVLNSEMFSKIEPTDPV